MDSIQFLPMAFKKRFRRLFVLFFIIILSGSYQSVILNICFLSSVSEASPVPSLRFPRDLSRPPPAVSWICVSLFSLQLSSFSLIVILVRSISDTANVGPFRKNAREERQKICYITYFLTCVKKPGQMRNILSGAGWKSCPTMPRRQTPNGTKWQKKGRKPCGSLPCQCLRKGNNDSKQLIIPYFSGVCSNVATKKS